MIDLSGHVIVLDLDDTLYLERDYAFSGFAAVGRWIEETHGISAFAEVCTGLFDRGVRANIFDRGLASLGPEGAEISVAAMVEIYRTHKPCIALAEDAARFLRRLRFMQSALISDGPLVCQQNKLAALDLERRIGRVILTDALPCGCGKPSPVAFELVEEWSRQPAEKHVYVADNLTKDFLAPRRRGWLTVQIRRPGRVHLEDAPTGAYAAVHAIETLDEIGLR